MKQKNVPMNFCHFLRAYTKAKKTLMTIPPTQPLLPQHFSLAKVRYINHYYTATSLKTIYWCVQIMNAVVNNIQNKTNIHRSTLLECDSTNGLQTSKPSTKVKNASKSCHSSNLVAHYKGLLCKCKVICKSMLLAFASNNTLFHFRIGSVDNSS